MIELNNRGKCMNTKQIYIATHCDFDGAVSQFLIEKITKSVGVLNSIDYSFIVEYCEFFNTAEVLDNFIEQIKTSPEIKKCFLLITDLVYLDNNRASKINDLYNRGLNVLYIDHHVCNIIETLDEKYDWIFYSSSKDKCASMLLYILIVNILTDKTNANSLPVNFDKKIELIKEGLPILKSVKKTNVYFNFFINLLGLENCISEDTVFTNFEKVVKEVYNLVLAANLVDHGAIKDFKGLDEIIKYWDMANELLDISKTSLLNELLGVANLLPDSMDKIRHLNQKLAEDSYFDQRIVESLNSIAFYNIFDKNNTKYMIAVCFGEGDISYIVDSFRFNLDNVMCINSKNIDVFISFTRTSVAQVPIFHIRALKTWDTLEFVQLIKKDDKLITSGTKIGVKGVYHQDIYLDIVNLRKNILSSGNGSDTEYYRSEIKSVIETELKRIFYKVEEIVK